MQIVKPKNFVHVRHTGAHDCLGNDLHARVGLVSDLPFVVLGHFHLRDGALRQIVG